MVPSCGVLDMQTQFASVILEMGKRFSRGSICLGCRKEAAEAGDHFL